MMAQILVIPLGIWFCFHLLSWVAGVGGQWGCFRGFLDFPHRKGAYSKNQEPDVRVLSFIKCAHSSYYLDEGKNQWICLKTVDPY